MAEEVLKNAFVSKKNKDMLIELHRVNVAPVDVDDHAINNHYPEAFIRAGEIHMYNDPDHLGFALSYPQHVEMLGNFLTYYGIKNELNYYPMSAYDAVNKLADKVLDLHRGNGGVFVFPVLYEEDKEKNTLTYRCYWPKEMPKDAHDIAGFIFVDNGKHNKDGKETYTSKTSVELLPDGTIRCHDYDIEHITKDTKDLAYLTALQLLKAYIDGVSGQLYEAWIYKMYTNPSKPITKILCPNYAEMGIRAVNRVIEGGVEPCRELYPHWCPPEERKSINDVAELVYMQKYGHRHDDGLPDKTPEEIAEMNKKEEGKPKKKGFFSFFR